MVADAMCIWTVTALPTLGPTAIEAESTSGSPSGTRCTHRPAPDHTGPCDRLISHRAHRMFPPHRTKSPLRRSVQATGRRREIPWPDAAQYPRSLSHLSLTLRCMASRKGWLGGYAPLLTPLWEPNGISIPVNDSERVQPSQGRKERTRVRPPASATHRIRPVLT
jgi:hypothetical protein